MSDGEFFGYLVLLYVGAAVLLFLGVRGFGQTKATRIGDFVFAAAFLGYAVYLSFFSRPVHALRTEATAMHALDEARAGNEITNGFSG